MNPGDEYKTFSKGATVNTVGQIFRLTRAASLVIFARFLGAKDFGLYFLVWSLTEIVQGAFSLGLQGGALWLASEKMAEGKKEEIRPLTLKIFIVETFLGILAVLIVFLFGPWVAEHLIKKPEASFPWFIFSLTTPFYFGSRVLGSALRATLKMHYEVLIYFCLEPAVILIVGIITLLLGLGIEGCVIAHLVSSIAGFILALILFAKAYPKESAAKNISPAWRPLLTYSFYLGGVDLLQLIKQRLDLIILGRFLTLEMVGIYSAVSEIGFIIKKIRNLFDTILMPIISRLRALKDKERLRRQFIVTLRWILILSLAFYGVLWISPSSILKIFGAHFAVGGEALLIFSLGEIFFATLGILECDLQMTGKSNIIFLNWGATVVINFVLLYLWIPKWGLNGAALATAAVLILMGVVRVFQVKFLEGFFPFHFSQAKVLAAWILSLLFTHFLSIPWKPLAIVLYLTCYFLFIRLFGLEAEDRKILKRVGP